MIQALAEQRLVNLHDEFFTRTTGPIPDRIVGVFDDIAASLTKSSDTYREIIGEMMMTAGYGAHRGFGLHETFLELVKEGVARGEVSTRHAPETLADIIVGALSGGLANWTVDGTYSLTTNLHDAAVALADLLSAAKKRGRSQ